MSQRNEIISLLERYLQVKFPKSYREFLLNKGHASINGLPIFGLSKKEPRSIEETPVVKATKFLRFHRPDLPKSLVVIRLLDVRALCLDLENGTSEDAPLVEINLKEKDIPPVQVHLSFKEYIEEGEKTPIRIKEALEQIKKCRESTGKREKRKFEHLKSWFHPRIENWRPIRSCVHDEVVGLCALKYEPLEDALLVAGFIATDHPNYEEGHGGRNLALIVLSDAYKTGSSMRIIFGKAIFDRNGIYRGFQSQRIPKELEKLAEEYGILFENRDKGEILPNEAISLYSELLEIPSDVKQKIDKLRGTGLTLQAFCYIIASNLWTKEEAIWLLFNHPRPEGILLGKDLPEDRLFYFESLTYGRAALAISRFRQKILIDLEERFPQEKEKIYCMEEIRGKFWVVKASHKFNLPWVIDNSEIPIEPNQPILILPRPYSITGKEIRDQKIIKDYFNKLKIEKVLNSIKIFLGSEELRELRHLKEIIEKFKKLSIYLILLPFTQRELDEEVDKRLTKARLIRK